MIKRYITLFTFLYYNITVAQCAMCKAVLETGDKVNAEAVNDGITYLMVFPYLLVGILAYAIVKYKKKQKTL